MDYGKVTPRAINSRSFCICQVSTCISTPIGNIQDKVGNSLEKIAEKADEAVKIAQSKVEKATNIFDKAKDKLVGWESKVQDHESQIRDSCDKVKEIKEELDDPCLESCGEGKPKIPWYFMLLTAIYHQGLLSLLDEFKGHEFLQLVSVCFTSINLHFLKILCRRLQFDSNSMLISCCIKLCYHGEPGPNSL